MEVRAAPAAFGRRVPGGKGRPPTHLLAAAPEPRPHVSLMAGVETQQADKTKPCPQEAKSLAGGTNTI